ncbi:hypothetical protein VP1G_00271 [Cytospora mali]|uniref:Uncharacterized protein n=1 Tax=Cytospora mali TaxID=578113 RepID=A0A194ULQ1_CYTMA|nr:hypothetical protein VP1G_00271 [Valsa mali var. pyri (nom. inval.)]
MDPEDLAAFYESLCTTKETSVKLWWLNDDTKSNEVTLDDNGVRNSLQSIRTSVIHPNTSEDVNRQFVLVSATGDPAYKNKPLRVARNTLAAILDACEFPSYTLVSCGLKRFHLSHHVQYGDKDEPVALILLLRIPRNSQYINVAMRICLCDLATVCFFTAMKEETGQGLMKKCFERSHLLKVHPLYFLALVFEERCLEYKEWFDKILEDINMVESATGMTRATWRVQLSDTLIDWFSDYDNLLRTLYAIHSELSHFDTVTTFSIKIGKFLSKVLELSEDLRVESGHERMSKREYGNLQQRIQFSLSRCELSSDKTREMLERVKGQINVVSQADTGRNY